MANGTIAFDTLQTSGQITGTAKSVDTDYVVNGSAKAWLNVNQEGTQAFRDSFNCSSITDIATGSTNVAYTNALANANYSLGGMARNSAGGGYGIVRISDPMSSTQIQFVGEDAGDTDIDCETATVNLFGDLA